MDREDVTKRLLADVASALPTSKRAAIRKYKPAHADPDRWTDTQKSVYAKIPADGWHMGYVSNALTYSCAVDGALSIRERQALHALMAAGHVCVVLYPGQSDERTARRDSPYGTKHYRIMKGDASAQ